MKYLKIKYPGNKIHNIIVKEFGYNTDTNQYFIVYYNLTEHKEMYSILLKDKDIYLKDEDINFSTLEKLSKNCNILEPKILPKEISCSKNESTKYKEKTKEVKQKQKKLFIVYETQLGTYLNSDLCKKYKVGSKDEKKFIEGQFCYKVTTEEIKTIEEKTKNNNYYLKPFYKVIRINNQEYFTVYTINSEFYINEDFCNEHNIGEKDEIKHIKNIKCYKVSKSEINKLEKNNFKASYNRIFQTQSQKSFTVYELNNDLYLKKDLCKKFNINSSISKNIEGFICYKVSNEDIKEIENSTKNNDPKLKARYRKINIDKTNEFLVLVAISGLYIEEELIKALNITSNKTKTYNNKKYYLVSLEVVKRIEKLKKVTAKYKEIPQKQSYFLVYNDLINLYVDEYIADLFRLNIGINTHHINNTRYVQVDQEDIEYIENITKNLDTHLKAKYIKLES